jgi:hypothetical protein
VIAINPLCVVILVPLLAPLSLHFSSFELIVLGSFITGVAPFILATGTNYVTCICFVTVISLGEAIWSPRLYE